jgi:hypothetical protein
MYAARDPANRYSNLRNSSGLSAKSYEISVDNTYVKLDVCGIVIVMDQVLASTEAREQLPKLIRGLISHPERRVELGRQRRREVVLVAATRYDEMIQREDAVRDIAWALFAKERIENPTSGSISWEDAQRKRRRSA